MGEKRDFLHRRTLINVDRRVGIENHHLKTVIVIIDSTKNHQWMLKSWVKDAEE